MLIIRVNRPNVISIKGLRTNFNIGLIKAFTKASIKAIFIKLKNSYWKITPGTSHSDARIANALATIWRIKRVIIMITIIQYFDKFIQWVLNLFKDLFKFYL